MRVDYWATRYHLKGKTFKDNDVWASQYRLVRGHSQTTLTARGEEGHELSTLLSKNHKFY